MSQIKSISILGCGWYGTALAKELIASGYVVKGSTTSIEKLGRLEQAGIIPFLVNFGETAAHDPEFFHCDVLIISIPPKRGQAGSYTAKIELVKRAIVQQHQVPAVVLVSSTGVYGDHNDVVYEQSPRAPDTESGKALAAAEEIFLTQNHFPCTILRFGGLIGEGRDPGRFFAGKKNISNGKAPVNLIQLVDCIRVTKAIINEQAFGHTFNACSPEHPEKMDFYTRASLKSGLEAPEFLPELLNWKIVSCRETELLLDIRIGPL